MALKSYCRLGLAVLGLTVLTAQTNMLTVEQPDKVAVKRNGTVHAKIKVSLQAGFHANSNTPSEEYLIPLRRIWTRGPLESVEVTYPKPPMEKYEFSAKPLSVFTGAFEIGTSFKAAADAPVGPGILAGKLRYQACNNKACFPPKTVDVKLPFSVQ